MPIQVTCPNCLKRFQVSDKFAGKQGPCPACKKTIRVPDASEAVTIHAPEDDGPKDSKGQSVLKPITRTDRDFTRRHLYIAAGVVIGMLFLALGFRFAFRLSGFCCLRRPWFEQGTASFTTLNWNPTRASSFATES